MDSFDVKKRYIIVGNSDTTEGRGSRIDCEVFEDLKEAYRIQQSGKYGTMGTPNTDIYEELFVLSKDGTFFAGPRTRVFGYKNGKHQWLIPNPFAAEDPEFAEFMRLYEKFKEYL